MQGGAQLFITPTYLQGAEGRDNRYLCESAFCSIYLAFYHVFMPHILSSPWNYPVALSPSTVNRLRLRQDVLCVVKPSEWSRQALFLKSQSGKLFPFD